MATTRQDDKSTQSAEHVRRTAEEVRRAGEETARKTSEGAAQFGRSALDAGERVTRSGSELMQQNAEVMRRAWQSYLQIAAQMSGRSGNEFGGLFGVGSDEARQAAEQSSRNVEAMVDSGSVIARGVEDISREWFDFARGRMEHNLSQISELARCRTPQQVAAVQSDLMRDNLEVLLQASRKVAEISARVAEDATGRMKNGVAKATRAA